MECHLPDIYAPFIVAMVKNPGVKAVIEDKYGCRVIQMCLEKVVEFCSSQSVGQLDKR
jgi:hypothetical protein